MKDDVTSEESTPTYELIAEPSQPLGDVVDTPAALARATEALRNGRGPVAVDTERAQSYRYSAKAYLIQLRREGAGTVLLDPVAFETSERADFSELANALADYEWIIHAATQDLPCLAEVKLLPQRLFDTELAGRLLGYPKVSLASLTERALGKTLAKEHSIADWSKRPLPHEWLNYAALDVELLTELREWISAELVAAGKEEWARQEFEALAQAADTPVAPRVDPWRRTSGIHELRSPKALAVVREVWHTRDSIAERIDRAPSRVLPDLAICELAKRSLMHEITHADLRAVKGFSWRLAKGHSAAFLRAAQRAQTLPASELPTMNLVTDAPPPPRTWGRRFPDEYARWTALRAAATAVAEEHDVPVQNLIGGEALKQLAWTPPSSVGDVDAFLATYHVRPWQRDLLVATLTQTLG